MESESWECHGPLQFKAKEYLSYIGSRELDVLDV